jgi:hypothetical protein
MSSNGSRRADILQTSAQAGNVRILNLALWMVRLIRSKILVAGSENEFAGRRWCSFYLSKSAAWKRSK